MITSSMSYSEMIGHLISDLPKVHYWAKKFLPKVIKDFRKELRLPLWRIEVYKQPETGNEFLISYYAENVYQKEEPIVMIGLVFWDSDKRFILSYQKAEYKHSSKHEFVETPLLYVFTRHFIKRYNERFLKNDFLTANEIIGIFLCRNLLFTPVDINKDINKNIDNYNSNASKGFKVRDGFCFTMCHFEGFSPDENRVNDRIDTLCFVFTTFESFDELKNVQIDAIDVEDAKIWKKYFEITKKRHSVGNIL